MDTQVPLSASRRNRVKGFFDNALHKIHRIKIAFALWSRDPRSSRGSSIPPEIIDTIAPSTVSPVEHTSFVTANQPTHPPTTSHDPCLQDRIEHLAWPSSNTPGANAVNTPGLSPSSSGAAITNSGPCRPGVWGRLEVALETLERSTRAIPPLHSVARAILDFMEIFESGAATNDGTYETLAGELDAVANTLNRYAIELGSEPASRDIVQIAESIQHCTTHINQLERDRRRKLFNPARDRVDVPNFCPKIESLSRELQDDLIRDLGHVEEAIYNSDLAMQLRRHGCIPETRTEVQDRFKTWARDPTEKFLWMNGMPGTGKTAISYSICEWLQQEQLLGASYFCTPVISACGSLRRLIPTIAYQLASSQAAFQSALCKSLEEFGNSSSLEPHLQFEWLLVKPLQEAKGRISSDLVIVIDGLDECEDDYSIKQVLEQLPEVIMKSMSEAGHAPRAICIHDIDPSLVRADIKKYLAESLKDLPQPPTAEQVEQLVRLSGNWFECAATIVKYVRHMEGDPTARLQTVLVVDSSTRAEAGISKTYEPLYKLYSTALEKVLKKNPTKGEMEDLQLVLWTVVCVKGPMTIKTLVGIVGIEENRVKRSFNWLHSVLHVPKSDDKHINILHTSFSDFIRNPPHPTAFHCQERSHHQFLAARFFKIMELQLKLNICRLETSFIADDDIFELERRVAENISPELFYACQYWSFHLQRINLSELEHNDAQELEDMLSRFLSTQLLPWMEILNLRKCIDIGVAVLSSARSWLLENNAWANIQQNLIDALDFFTWFASNSCSISTPHIYLSALPSYRRSNSVYRNYWPLTRRLLDITRSAVKRSQDALAEWPAGGPVSSLTCSLDGTMIVSGSCDGTVQLWDTHTGMVLGPPTKTHKTSVLSMKFSRDGMRLASGSSDHTICLYDVTTTGIEINHTLIGHQAPIFALEFTSDGACIASGSGDGTVRLWNPETGVSIGEPLRGELKIQSIAFSSDDSHVIALGTRTTATKGVRKFEAIIQTWDLWAPTHPSTVQSLSGHHGAILSADLSPDGTRIVTAGSDHKIRIWQADTGTPIGQAFKAHRGEVLAVKFSFGGSRIISGSVDGTIRVWDVHTGFAIGEPFEGHSGAVGTIVPIPGDTRIVSGSDDATIRVWDAGPPTHSDSICSVTFSPNGDLVFSGSEDKTMRVWDVRTGNLVGMSIYNDAILAVAWSPDNKHYATGSRDATIRVGDIHPGPRFGESSVCRKHDKAVQSIAFSADGTLLVTGSEDRSVKAWDPSERPPRVVDESFAKHIGPVTAVALGRRDDAHLVVSGSGDTTIGLHCTSIPTQSESLRTESEFRFPGHEKSILSVACSSSGDCIVSGSYDQTIRVWHRRPGARSIEPICGHSKAVRSVALFELPNDIRIIASGSDDTTVRLWNADTGGEIDILKGHTEPVWSVAFSRDGKYIVSGSKNGEIRMWDIESRWPPAAVNAGPGSVSPQPDDGRRQPPKDNDAGRMSSWTFHGDGWIKEGNRLLFWVPKVHHNHLNRLFNMSGGPCSLTISKDFSYGIESWDLAVGEDWTSCFNAGQQPWLNPVTFI
ncbi:hypothetical protein OPQ81_011848 [Rhizoctonia solani]|nr:hypothetical protein OPQ81_011848 [Rhizoctonia solani]